jgi:hypothetical protein
MRETEREREQGNGGNREGEGNGNRGIEELEPRRRGEWELGKGTGEVYRKEREIGTGTKRRGEWEQCNWGMLYNKGNGE